MRYWINYHCQEDDDINSYDELYDALSKIHEFYDGLEQKYDYLKNE